jgi:putative drug exporter of the RND superfamily
MRRLARWCVTHRLAVIAIWLVVLVGAVFIGSSTGSNYTAGTTASGTQSATAQNLLKHASPGAAGDTEQIVFATHGKPITGAAVRGEIQPMLGKVARLPNVASVTSPYSPAGAKQISHNGTIAFASVNFTKDASAISTTAATTFVDTARAVNSKTLQVDVEGQVAASTNSSSQISTLIGVVAALVILLVVLGSVLPALIPLLSTGIALGAAVSIVGALSTVVSMASFTQQLCLLIGLGVGIDYSLFLLTRIRTGLRHGLSTQDAVINASATAGRAVLFAAITVCIALCGMFIVGVSILSGAAIAASIAVLFSMAAAQTLVPASAGLLGRRVMTRKQRKALDAGDTTPPEASARWSRWAGRVQAHRLVFGVAALAVMLGLAVPAVSLRMGTADYGTDPTTTTTTTHRAYEMLVKGFGPGFSGPLELVAPIHSSTDRVAFGKVVTAVRHTPGVVSITPTQVLPAGPGHPAVAVSEAYPSGSPQAVSTSNLITHLRDAVIPHAIHGTSTTVYVGGQTAQADDQATQLTSKLPLFVGVVVALSFLLLMLVFRSLLIPATASVMNLLSAGAAFGIITAVFQNGFLDTLVGVSRTGPVSPLVPILMFAVLFGLSMDYEVFLVSRMHEEWLKTHDNAKAVNRGQAITGRTITALATIMVCVFLSFVLGSDRTIKMIGLGMASAIAVDALLVRTILVPAIMHSLGDANWRLPAWLNRHLPHLDIEGEAISSPLKEPATEQVRVPA